jgi:hypothetical protein
MGSVPENFTYRFTTTITSRVRRQPVECPFAYRGVLIGIKRPGREANYMRVVHGLRVCGLTIVGNGVRASGLRLFHKCCPQLQNRF